MWQWLLGYSNSRKAVADHCKGVTKRDTLTEGGVQLLSYIPEGDVYRLIVSSKITVRTLGLKRGFSIQ